MPHTPASPTHTEAGVQISSKMPKKQVKLKRPHITALDVAHTKKVSLFTCNYLCGICFPAVPYPNIYIKVQAKDSNTDQSEAAYSDFTIKVDG